MHYYVDGYNFLFRICQTDGALEKRRNRLIDLLNQEVGFLKGRCSLVFDSVKQIRECPECAFLANLEVVYTPKGLTADQYIIELVEHSPSPKMLTIVTSDSGLARQCRHLGAYLMTIEDFIALIIKKSRQKKVEKPTILPSSAEIERLRKIFEKRLENED